MARIIQPRARLSQPVRRTAGGCDETQIERMDAGARGLEVGSQRTPKFRRFGRDVEVLFLM
jgi:hypothetical protein